MDWKNCDFVEVIPGKVSGVPLLKGSRVPADQVVESLEAGETVAELAYNFDLDPKQILLIKLYKDDHQLALKP